MTDAFNTAREPEVQIPAQAPQRVLWIGDKLGFENKMDGMGRMWLNCLPAFNAARVEIIPCVLRLHPDIQQRFLAEAGVRLVNLRKGRYDISAIGAIYRLIRKHDVDVLHLQGYGSTTLGRIAGLVTGVPSVIHQHDADPRFPRYMGWIDRCLASSTGSAVAVSEGVADFCVGKRHIPSDRVAVIPNGITPGWARAVGQEPISQLRRELGISGHSRIIGSVTRFHPDKDLPSLLEAARQLQVSGCRCHVVLVGDGPDRPLLEKRIADLGLSGLVHLVGFQSDVRPYLSLMDVVVFSSVSEGFPLALLEAMAMGRPVVVTSVGGMTDLVYDRRNGLVVPPRDPGRLADAISALLTEPQFAAGLASQAAGDAALRGVAQHILSLEQLYELLASRTRKNRRRSVMGMIGSALRRVSGGIATAYRKNRGHWQGLVLRRYPKFVWSDRVRRIEDQIPVFVFHGVDPDRFEGQLRYLQANGYHTMENADAFCACLTGDRSIESDTVLLTFDDGLESLYTVAYPMLKRYGLRAVSFVAPPFVGKPGFCTWEQLREMDASGVVDVQSHTLWHRYVPAWPRIIPCLDGAECREAPARADMVEEFRQSRELIESRLGKSVRHLCYPDYDGTPAGIAASKASGYSSNFWGILAGRNTNRRGDDPFRIVRVHEDFVLRLPGKGRQSLFALLAGMWHRYGGRMETRLEARG